MARVVWNSLSQARSVDIQIKEDTITDFLLLKMKRDYSDLLTIHDFSTREEAKTGADWEWWFTERRQRWLGFRVQAKIVNFKSNAFERLHYDNGLQCQKLIDNAIADGVCRIPIYCLYHQYNAPNMLQKCSSIAGAEGYKTLGVSLVPAASVQALFNQKGSKPINDLHALSANLHPWHRLVCGLHGGINLDLPELMLHNWKELVPSAEWGTPRVGEEQYILDDPPRYVADLMSRETRSELPNDVDRLTVLEYSLYSSS